MKELISRCSFRLCHGRQLVYNTCWEDPRLDRAALDLGPDDELLVITSAGCNALDYALDAPRHIHAVDVNFRQNALLELKLAGIRRLDHATFFEWFGRGRHAAWEAIYREELRRDLSPAAQQFWDRNARAFDPRRGSLYFHGSSGTFAWLVNHYIDRVAHIRRPLTELLEAETLEEQCRIYHAVVKPAFWGPMIRWLLRRDAVLALLGVPRAQRRQLERRYPGGIAKFIEDRIDQVFMQRRLADNYFWRVYLTGQYAPDCCPDYLRPESFARLKGGLADRVSVHTTTVLEFLRCHKTPLTRLVLLDHMDWLTERHRSVLHAQWQAIVDNATHGARILWRSAALDVDFIDPIEVESHGQRTTVGELLSYRRQLAAKLHSHDRVNTYGSFYVADLPASDKVRNESRSHAQDVVPSHVGARSRCDA